MPPLVEVETVILLPQDLVLPPQELDQEPQIRTQIRAQGHHLHQAVDLDLKEDQLAI